MAGLMPRFTTRFLLAATLLLALAAAIAAAGNVGARAMASLGAALPVVAVV